MSRAKELLQRKKQKREVENRAKTTAEELEYYEHVTEIVADEAEVDHEDAKQVLTKFFEFVSDMTDEGSADCDEDCIVVPGFGVFYPQLVFQVKNRTKEWRIAFLDEKSSSEEYFYAKGDE